MPVTSDSQTQTQALLETIRDSLSPHAVALLIAKLQPVYGSGQAGQQAERELAWLAQQLIDLLGQCECEQLCEELGL